MGSPPVKRGRGRPPKYPRPGMPGYVPPPAKPSTPRLKLDGKPKAKPGRKPGSTLSSTEKKPKPKKVSPAAKKTSTDSSKKEKDAGSNSRGGGGGGESFSTATAAASSKAESQCSKSNSQPPQLSPQPPSQSANNHSGSKMADSHIYDFQSDDADSQKAFAVGVSQPVLKQAVVYKKYWTPPPTYTDKQITITDVVSDGVAVTFRESKCADFLSKRELERELNNG